jgi:acetyl-CoA carboxylase alpha subunit
VWRWDVLHYARTDDDIVTNIAPRGCRSVVARQVRKRKNTTKKLQIRINDLRTVTFIHYWALRVYFDMYS